MLLSLENDAVRIEVNSFGAELWGLYNHRNSRQLLWRGQEPWNRRAPILFPIVGRLINDTYSWNNKSYHLDQHGFARGMEFALVKRTENLLHLRLIDDESTIEAYPFRFEFDVMFELTDTSLKQIFRATNRDTDRMPVSFGAHPAFNIGSFDDTFLQFSQLCDAPSDTVEEGIRTGEMRKVMNHKVIQLSADLFNRDALIYEMSGPEKVSLISASEGPILTLSFEGFTFLGIWAKPGASFVCIEPWVGVADKAGHSGLISEKEGVVMLKPGETLERSLQLSFNS